MNKIRKKIEIKILNFITSQWVYFFIYGINEVKNLSNIL